MTEHCDWRTFLTADAEMPPEVIAALDKHFQRYCQPEIKEEDGKESLDAVCPGCGKHLTGLLLGTFTWGIAHGEGHCAECGWPATGHHFIFTEGENGEDFIALHNFPLAVHPDFVTRRDKQEATK